MSPRFARIAQRQATRQFSSSLSICSRAAKSATERRSCAIRRWKCNPCARSEVVTRRVVAQALAGEMLHRADAATAARRPCAAATCRRARRAPAATPRRRHAPTSALKPPRKIASRASASRSRRAEHRPRLLEDDARCWRGAAGWRGSAALQQLAALAQLGGDRVAREHARPRRGELEGERQAPRPGGRCRRSPPPSTDGTRPGSTRCARLHEQAHGVERLGAVRGPRGSGNGRPSSGSEHAPAASAGRTPRGDHDASAPGMRLQQAGRARRRGRRLSCSKLSSTSSSLARTQEVDQRIERDRPSPRRRAADALARRSGRPSCVRRADVLGARRTMRRRRSAAPARASARRARPRLADAAGADQREQAAAVAADLVGDAPAARPRGR